MAKLANQIAKSSTEQAAGQYHVNQGDMQELKKYSEEAKPYNRRKTT